MVLVSLVLVVVAAITLVIGLLQSGLTIIYISIGCSVAAGLVLAAAVLRGRPEPKFAGAPVAPPGPQPGPVPATQPSGSWQGPQPAPVGAAAPGAQPVTAGATAQVGAAESAAAGGAGWAPDATQQLEQVAVVEEDEIDEVELPIDDYDSLRASDIIPLLADLDAGELEQVRRHEEAGKHRFTVLRRIDSELATREPAGWEVSEEEWEEEVVGDGGVVAVVVEEVPEDEADEEAEEELEDEFEELEDEFEVEEEEEEEEEEAPARARGRSAGFPIADYDQLMMLEVLPRLVDLDTDELLTVRQREESGLSRSTILNRIDRLLEQQTVRPTATARRLSARKTAASRAPAKKTAARKAASRKTAAKKAPARKTAAKKAPARKTAAKKAPARKTAAKKTAARKTTRRG